MADVSQWLNLKDDFAKMAKALKVTKDQAKTVWQKANLDGDERASVAKEFDLTWTGPGRHGPAEFQRALAKLKPSKTKRLSD